MTRDNGPITTDVERELVRELRMHPALLWSVITKQAGSLAKALLEGVMNSADAGATRCDLTLTRHSFSIDDNGRGFATMAEIEDHFETFGFPHDDGDALFGRFRMGRGQMMAFGRNVWRSHTFRMTVDIEPQQKEARQTGLRYRLTRDLPRTPGCAIAVDLYVPLLSEEMFKVEAVIRQTVRYMSLPITLNGVRISTDPATEDWDKSTKDAWIRFDTTDRVAIYNQGAYVCDERAWKFGTGGTVVSKHALEVNFARNAVLNTCPRWKRINEIIRVHAGEKIERTKALSSVERGSAIDRFRSGEMEMEKFGNLLTITYVNGTRSSLLTLLAKVSKSQRIGVVPPNERGPCKVHERGQAVVLAPATLDAWDCRTIDELKRAIAAAMMKGQAFDGPVHDYTLHDRLAALECAEILTAEEIRSMVENKYQDVQRKDLGPQDARALRILTAGVGNMQSAIQTAFTSQRLCEMKHGIPPWVTEIIVGRCSERRRAIRAGDSPAALAWTDGEKTIWFERRQLKLVSQGRAGMTSLALLGLHELLHGEPDTDTHVHDIEFYQTFHDIAIGSPIVGRAVATMIALGTRLRKEDVKKLGGAFLMEARSAEMEERFDITASRDRPRPPSSEEDETLGPEYWGPGFEEVLTDA